MGSCCMPGQSSMALFTRAAKLDLRDHGARCAWAMAVHHAVGISRQRNSGYRLSRVNIMPQDLSTPNLFSVRRGRATTTHYTLHQLSLMVSRNTTLVPSLGLRIGSACEAGLSAGMRRERVPPQIRTKEKLSYCKNKKCAVFWDTMFTIGTSYFHYRYFSFLDFERSAASIFFCPKPSGLPRTLSPYIKNRGFVQVARRRIFHSAVLPNWSDNPSKWNGTERCSQ